jgi:hypothetical protein
MSSLSIIEPEEDLSEAKEGLSVTYISNCMDQEP